MKILYDLRAYQKYEKRGIGRYIYEVFSRAMRMQQGDIAALIDEQIALPMLPDDISSRIHLYLTRDFEERLPQETRFDVLLNGAVFQRAGKSSTLEWLYPPAVLNRCGIVTGILYDFIPLLFPASWHSDEERLMFSLQMEAAKQLEHLFPISLFTLCSGVRYLDLAPDRFTCLYGGADEQLFHSQNSELPYDHHARSNHLIYISGDAMHKNNAGLVRAFCAARTRNLIPTDASLYLVCRASEGMISNTEQLTNALGCKYGRDVFVTNYIPDAEMVHLLSTARASIFPSFYEGLGLPILESYTAGTPCFASAYSATREFILPECGFDPFDVEDMVRAITRIYADPALCADSLAYGRRLIASVNWDTAAEKLLQKLSELTS